MTANPTLLSMPLAQNGQKNVIPETQATPGNGLFSQSTGFPAETSLPLGAGGVAPSREDFNGMANLLGGVAYYAQKGWQFQFDAGQDYFAGCIVRDTTDGKLYECINDVAAGGSVPSADSVNWKAFSTGGVQVGFIMPYAGTGLADGWLDCDGSAVSRTMYADLFSVIGTTYGSGDGSTTFNLPNEEFWEGVAGSAPVFGVENKPMRLAHAINTTADDTPYWYAPGSGMNVAMTSANYGANIVPQESAPSNVYADMSNAPQYSANIRYMIKYE